MANPIQIKRSATTAIPPSLLQGELAWSESSDTLYIGETGSAITAIAGPGTFAKINSPTFTGNPAISTAVVNSANDTSIATTAFVKNQAYLTGNQNITVSGDATGSGTTAIALTLAAAGTAGTYTKVTTDAKGRVTTGATLAATDIPALTASKISDFDTQVRLSRLDQMAAPTSAVSLNSQRITSVATPSVGTDAANKDYVDAARMGMDVKESVRAATTATITLSAPQTIDGVAVIAGDRVLVKNQSSGAANGIYVVAAAAWTRATDANISAEVTPGMFCFVEEGTANADSGWILSTNAAITLDTTALVFTQFSGAGSLTAGDGMTQSGSTFNVVGTTNRITVSADAIDIASTYVGQATITTLGTVTTGVWNGTLIPLQYGGTGTALNGAADGAIFKKSGTGLVAAVLGTDYLSNTSTLDGGSF
jgi:phage-related tail fiber protein